MFINIDRERRPQNPKYYLSKPNGEIVANMTGYKRDDSGSFKLGNVHEINFTIPYYLEDDFNLVYNEDVELIREKMLVKMTLGSQVEWFIIDEIEDQGDDSESMSVVAYSLAYELTHKKITAIELIGVNATDALEAILEDPLYPSTWQVDYIHYKFNNLYRSFEINDSNALDAVLQIAEAFDALVKWDTVQRKVSFLDKETDGKGEYKGLTIDYGKLLKVFKRSRTTDEMVTRLYVSGSEGLGIHNINPTGQSYIEDFSYFMYPFEIDSNGRVIKSSYFMSDELCIALKRYEVLVANYAPQFKTLNQNRAKAIGEKVNAETKLFELETQLDRILDRLDTAKATGNEGLISQIQGEKSGKESEIASQESLLTGIKSNIFSIESSIRDLTNKLIKDANFTLKLIKELNLYVIERDFKDERYIDEQDLYDDAIKKFKSMREPKVVINIDVENFLEVVEEQYYWDKLILGDLIKIRYPLMNVEYMAKIVQIDYDFKGNGISLTIANTTKLNDMDAMNEILYNSKTASTIIMNNKNIFEKFGELDGRVWRLLNDEWDANKQKITAGVNNEIEIGKRGIIITSPDNPREMVVMQSGIIALSEDGGETWKTAMKPNGIVAERIIGKLIMSTRLVIEDENGIIKFTGSLQQIFDDRGNIRIEIGNYAQGKFGMRVHGGSLEIVGGLDKNQIDPNAVSKWDNSETNANSYTNGINSTIRKDLRLTAPLPTSIIMNNEGITAYSNTNSNNFARMDYRGLYIQGGAIDIRTSYNSNQGVIFRSDGISAYNYSGTRTFHVDTNGNLTANNGSFGGTLNSANGTFTGTLSAVNGTFTGTLSAVSGTFTSLTSGTISGATITGTSISGATITGTNISGTNVSGGTITGTKITGSDIVGGTISTTTDLTIGNNIYLGSGSSWSTKRAIYFNYPNGVASISYESDTIYLSSINGVSIPSGILIVRSSTQLAGSFDISGVTSMNWGNNRPTAVFG